MRTVPRIAVAALVTLSACNSAFFKITKENEQAPASSPAPAQKPAEKPAEKPPEAPPRRTPPQTPPVRTPPVQAPPVQTLPTQQAVTPAPASAPAVFVDRIDPDATPEASDADGIERLVQLATVWSTVANFHPFDAARGARWDSALIRTIPAVRAARSPADVRSAIERMLGVLSDDATGFGPRGNAPAFPSRPTSATVLGDSTMLLVLSLEALARNQNAGEAPEELVQALTRAGAHARLVVDVRSANLPTEDARRAARVFDNSNAVSALLTEPLVLPVERRRVVGLTASAPAPATFVIGGEPSAWRAPAARVIQPTGITLTRPVPRRGRSRAPAALDTLQRRIVIVANGGTALPGSLAALVASGRAFLVTEGAYSDAHLVTRHEMQVGQVGTLHVRLGELVHANGTGTVRADSVVAGSSVTDSTAASVRAALSLVRSSSPTTNASARMRAAAAAPSIDTAAYPSMTARLLGVFRTWSAMRTLHAHRDAYDDDVDDVFRQAIASAERARTAGEYAAAVLTLASSTDDSGVRLRGASIEALYGQRVVPFRVRWAEGRILVSELAVDPDQRFAGISVGDEIVSVDGYPVTSWIVEQRRQVAASSDWMRAEQLLAIIERGERDALLRVRDARGTERAVSVPRRIMLGDTRMFSSELPGAGLLPVRALANNILYVNGTTVREPFTLPAGTRAVIVDLRGPLVADGSLVAQLVPPAASQVVAREVRRTLSEPCNVSSLRAAQYSCSDERSVLPVVAPQVDSGFGGLVAVLIDERTDAAAERLALRFETMGARLLGSPTAGALSSPSSMTLPGLLTLEMPLYEVRRSDGGQLHRAGLSPLVDIRPTVRGVRNGIDDVLERAQQWVQQELDPPARRRR